MSHPEQGSGHTQHPHKKRTTATRPRLPLYMPDVHQHRPPRLGCVWVCAGVGCSTQRPHQARAQDDHHMCTIMPYKLIRALQGFLPAMLPGPEAQRRLEITTADCRCCRHCWDGCCRCCCYAARKQVQALVLPLPQLLALCATPVHPCSCWPWLQTWPCWCACCAAALAAQGRSAVTSSRRVATKQTSRQWVERLSCPRSLLLHVAYTTYRRDRPQTWSKHGNTETWSKHALSRAFSVPWDCGARWHHSPLYLCTEIHLMVIMAVCQQHACQPLNLQLDVCHTCASLSHSGPAT